MTRLPVAFEEKIKKLLQGEYESYLASYQNPKYQGFRVNTSKIELKEWEEINPFDQVKPVAWCKEGFYYEEARPAKHPYYYAGLYYLQEPSAMAPGAYIPIEKGDKVLDLCAAPGGKSTQVLAKLEGTGLLVSNDISATRAKALVKNIENFGARNTMVCSEEPSKLASKWQGYFDKILIDAPCSGEGMFRKDDTAIKSWEKYGVEYFCEIQKEILQDASKMLKVGGMMLYSTCTFSPEENEQMIEQFIINNPEFSVVPLQPVGGIQKARPDWCEGLEEVAGGLRLWPHHLEGEGHFVCLLQKNDGKPSKTKSVKTKKIKDIEGLAEFIEENTLISVDESVVVCNDKVYMLPDDAPEFKGIRMLRSGLLLGELKRNRFKPYHAMTLSFPKEMFKNIIDFDIEDINVVKYLKGETLNYEATKGYHVICVGGYPLGFVKAQNNILKNQYPANWRMMG